MSDQVLVNGNLLSKASVTLKCEGEPFYGFTTLEWGDKRERSYGRGAGRSARPRGKTKGQYTPDPFVMTVHADTSEAILNKLSKLPNGRRSIGEPSVLWTITVDEPGVASILNEIEGCTLAEIGDNIEDSAEGAVVKLTWMPMGVKRNGRSLYDSSTGT